ncbi:hypothetical protein ACET3Z_011255 [Daucus carota]
MELPCDMIEEILCCSRVRDLLQYRCVSREWCSVIDSTAFAKKHLKKTIECNADGVVIFQGEENFYLADLECLAGKDDVAAIKLNDPLMANAFIFGAANGLVCLEMDEMNEFLFFNPSTRQVRKIPTFPAEFPCFNSMDSSWGFGYDHLNDDFKVVKIGQCLVGHMVFVYSMKTNSWTRIKDVPILFSIDAWGVFASGALHWEAVKDAVNSTSIILTFDLETEQFREAPFPSVDRTSVKYYSQRLFSVGGSLCILDNCLSHMDVYLMDSYGAEHLWHKAFSVERPGTLGYFRYLRPIAFSKSGNVVILEVDDEKLVWYDIENKVVRKNGIPNMFLTQPYTESLLQLNEDKHIQKPQLASEREEPGKEKMDGIDPNRVTLVSLLHAAAQLQDVEYGRLVHGYATRRGIGCFEEVFETCLMDMYLKCGKPYNAMILCSNMKFRSVASWNALIVGHLQLGQPEEALNLFVLMIQERQKPDLISLANGILCCADLGLLREGKSVQGYAIRSGIELDIVTITALIDLYLKSNNTYTALKLFNGIEDKDVISCNVMMTGFLQSGSANEVMKIFREMVIRGIKPNQSTFLSIITACSNLGDIRQGKFIHGYVIRHNFESNTDIANQVIYMYAKCHFIDCARKVFNRLKRKDLVSWTSMMMGYVNDGHADEAMYLFCLMQGDGVLPDSVTLICLLQAFTQLKYFSLAKEVHSFMYRVCMENEIPVINSLLTTYSKSGKLHLSEKLFAHMKRRNLASWNSMIAAYGMHGRCHDALNLFKLMEKKCIVPDELTITSVLSACSHSGLVEEGLSVFRVHGKTKLGEVIGRQFMEIESQNPSAYGMVSNLYAEDDRWDAAAQIRSAANKRGFKRTAGYSMVELENQRNSEAPKAAPTAPKQNRVAPISVLATHIMKKFNMETGRFKRY